jgi:hypothetical protein
MLLKHTIMTNSIQMNRFKLTVSNLEFFDSA